jgi:hypothetical protein
LKTKKTKTPTKTKSSPDKIARIGKSGVQLTESQLGQVAGGINFTKIEI